MICKNCKTRNEDNSKFCMKCGNNLVEQTPVVFCSECLEMVEQDDKFCGQCGAPVANGITEDEMLNKKANNAKGVIHQQAIINSTVNEEVQNEKQSKLRLKRIALIAVPLCCILIIGVGIGLANSADTPTDPNETAQNEQDEDPTVEATENQTPEITEEETDGSSNTSVEPPIDLEYDSDPSYEYDQDNREEALEKAKGLIEEDNGLSRAEIIVVLTYTSVELLALEDAEYAADNCGANWNEHAVNRANSISHYSRENLIDSLVNIYRFTQSQAEYAATAVGY